ncbi:MAG: efflux RND transporter periplasmic adaptor subunit [Betaproteobacteria bacterium]|nr:efflux RND transporter periplasmic adaptor subunit [Betaproteobacteria bacterium]
MAESNLRHAHSLARFALASSLFLALASGARADSIATAPVQYREVDLTYAAEAVVEATRQSTVSAQVSGRIVDVRFDVGDYVKKGQVIVRIDQTEAQQVLAGSEAQVAQAQAAYDNARVEYERTRDLAKQKFVSQAALDKAQAALRVAEAQLRTAKAGAGQAATTKSYTTIVAPYSGVVSARHVEVGEMASPGKPLLTGFDPSDLRVIATIPQYKVAEIRASPRVTVEIPSLKRWIPGRSITVLPTADSVTHSTKVRVDLPSDLRDVYPGVYARAHFTVGRGRKLVMPASALIRRSEVTGAYVVGDQGHISFRQIRVGETLGDGLVEVLAGLTPGEKVALEPVKAGMSLDQSSRK